jgi:hypothetical protein
VGAGGYLGGAAGASFVSPELCAQFLAALYNTPEATTLLQGLDFYQQLQVAANIGLQPASLQPAPFAAAAMPQYASYAAEQHTQLQQGLTGMQGAAFEHQRSCSTADRPVFGPSAGDGASHTPSAAAPGWFCCQHKQRHCPDDGICCSTCSSKEWRSQLPRR